MILLKKYHFITFLISYKDCKFKVEAKRKVKSNVQTSFCLSKKTLIIKLNL